MRSAAVAKIIPGIAVVICVFLMAFWFASNRRSVSVAQRVPGQDQAVSSTDRQGGAPQGLITSSQSVTPVSTSFGLVGQTGQTVSSGASAPTLPGSWPQFRGPHLNDISTETVPLISNLQTNPPRMIWGIDVGDGYAGAAISNSRVYLLDYDKPAQADVLRCLALADGKELWHYAYPAAIKENHGMSRTVPAVSGKYVVTLGPLCQVLCADAETGQAHWKIDLVNEYHTEIPPWYAGQCPLIDGDKAIIAPAGSSLMIAIDLATGRVVWKSPNPNNWSMTHSSITPMTFNGQKMYIYCGSGGVAGISAADGSILWQTTDWTVKIANIPSPVPIGEDRIFLSGGYDAGSMMLQLQNQSGRIVPRTVFRLGPDVFGSAQQTPIYYKGYIYGVIPDGTLTCLTLDGKQKWNSGSTYKFGMGPYIIADGKIFVMNDTGVFTMADATPNSFHPLGQVRILNGPDSWGPMALAGGRLIARDRMRMVCIDVSKH